MKDAYSIIEGLSSSKTNIQRLNYCSEVALDISRKFGYEFKIQKFNAESRRGNENIIIDSGHPSPILLTAHYDAVFRKHCERNVVPAANDNGSGIGCVLEAIQHLKGLPVNVVLFGAEELYGDAILYGSRRYVCDYVLQQKNKPRAVINLDSCGVGPGIKMPDVVRKSSKLYLPVEPTLLRGLESELEYNGLSVVNKNGNTTSDHLNFVQAGIPACAIIGDSDSYFGFGEFKGKAIYHTDKDTLDIIDKNLIEKVTSSVVSFLDKYSFDK